MRKDKEVMTPLKELKKNWKTEVLYHRTKKNEEIADLKYRMELLNQSLENKEKSILALIERMQELESDLKYEVRLNEKLKDELNSVETLTFI